MSLTKTIKSPLLLWSDGNSYVILRCTMTKPKSKIVERRTYCYSDLEGKVLKGFWLTNVTLEEFPEHKKCFRTIHPKYFPSLCETFRLELKVYGTSHYGTSHGIVTLDQVDFGGPTICEDDPIIPTTSRCNFEADDCGIRTDFCSLYDWNIQNNDIRPGRDTESQDKRNFPKKTGLSLQRRNITSKDYACSYPVCIPCFQSSGLNVHTIMPSFRGDSPRPLEGRGLSGRSLALDPSTRPGEAVGPAVLDLRDVWHHPDNTYMTFRYSMIRGGRHHLAVTARCTARVQKDSIALGKFRRPYFISNLNRLGKAGFICLDIHKYVSKTLCPKFTIQFVALALDKKLILDDIEYKRVLPTRCGKNGIDCCLWRCSS